MAKINTPEELRLMREKLRADLEIRENSNTPDELPQIRVSMYGHEIEMYTIEQGEKRDKRQ